MENLNIEKVIFDNRLSQAETINEGFQAVFTRESSFREKRMIKGYTLRRKRDGYQQSEATYGNIWDLLMCQIDNYRM